MHFVYFLERFLLFRSPKKCSHTPLLASAHTCLDMVSILLCYECMISTLLFLHVSGYGFHPSMLTSAHNLDMISAGESADGSVDLSRLSLRDGGLLARLERDFERELEESATDYYATPAQLSSAPTYQLDERGEFSSAPTYQVGEI